MQSHLLSEWNKSRQGGNMENEYISLLDNMESLTDSKNVHY